MLRYFQLRVLFQATEQGTEPASEREETGKCREDRKTSQSKEDSQAGAFTREHFTDLLNYFPTYISILTGF